MYSFIDAGVSSASMVPDINPAPHADSGFPLIVASLIIVYMFFVFSLILSKDSFMELRTRV